LGIYNLNLIIGFLSPQTDPEADGPSLPTKVYDLGFKVQGLECRVYRFGIQSFQI
jgi:hypothetical protein